jgi:hypothetical protein
MPTNDRETDVDGERPPWTFAWQAIWLGHAAGAALAWWLLPGGFPWEHPRFWINRVLPWIVVAVSGMGLVGVWRKNSLVRQSAAVFIVAVWTSALVASTITYPISARRFWPPALVITGLIWAACLVSCRRHWSWRWPVLTALAAGSLIGAILPLGVRAPEADTTPLGDSTPWPRISRDSQPVASTVRVSRIASLAPQSAEAEVRFGRVTISVRPLLEFESVSPDRCWTIFTPRSYRPNSRLRLVDTRSDAQDWYRYQASFVEHLLHVESAAGGAGILVEAFSRLEQPIYSHLNSFCELTISGHQRMTLSFSPCPDARIEAHPTDYPVGRPARFAYVDSEGTFHVVEAQNAEKGPFRPLGQGHLGDAPLQITIFDADRAVCRLRIDDWARQAGRQLSPTAGWGVPVNTLAFSRLDDNPATAVWLWMSLSSTSVGRGWDSVGHTAGTYRNRLSIKPVPEGE